MSGVMRGSTVSSSEEPEAAELKVYGFRWAILAMFCALMMTNALFWVTFSPISDITQHYFGSGSYYSSTTGVNMLANVFLIFYLPGTLFGVLLMKYCNLKRSFVIAGLMTVLGGLLRYIATLCADSLGEGTTYWLIFLGQAMAAMAQPVFLNMPPAVASIWFPVSERDMATTIGSMCSPIGNAAGQLLPILFVSETSSQEVQDGAPETVYEVHGMEVLMLAELLLSLLPVLLAMALFRDAPPTPPSHSTLLKQQSSKQHPAPPSTPPQQRLPAGSFSHSVSRKLSFTAHPGAPEEVPRGAGLREDLRTLANCRDYWVLFVVFSFGVGFFEALLTLLNQIVSPFGYSNDDAGTLGAVFIVCGLAGAAAMSHVMERTRAYKQLLLLGTSASLAAGLLFVLMLFSGNLPLLVLSFALLGAAVLPLLPVMMENCAEVTYPVPEDLSMGLMFVGSNLLGLAFIFVLQALLDMRPWGPPPLLPSNAFIVCMLVVPMCSVLLYRGNYRRMHLERRDPAANPLHEPMLPPQDSNLLQQFPAPSGGAGAAEDSRLVRVASADNRSSAWHAGSVSGRQSTGAAATFWS